jgi:hypothetical protein
MLDRRFRRPAREDIRKQRQANEEERPDERGDPDPGMEEEADANVERHPRQIEEGGRADAGEKAPHLVETARGLQAVAAGPRFEWKTHQHVEDATSKRTIKISSDAHEHAGADEIEHALEGIERKRQDGEPDEGGHAAARDNTIVDLQHEKRAREIEHVDHGRHQTDAQEGTSASRQSSPKLGAARCGACRFLQRRSHGQACSADLDSNDHRISCNPIAETGYPHIIQMDDADMLSS